MAVLILGLVLFLGVHSVRIVADDWRSATRARIGENAWKGLYSVLSLVGFVLITASQLPGNSIRARLRHPMVLGVKLWAAAHLLANNTLADLLLFGSFLLWAVLDFRSSRQRDRAQNIVYPPGRLMPTLGAVALGLGTWALFAFWAHGALIGVRPFG